MSLAVGLMSGTSIDGVDAAVVEIRGGKYRIKAWQIFPFPHLLKKRLLKVCHPNRGSTAEVCRLHFELGGLLAACVRQICRKARIPLAKIDVIGSHGQTICHFGRRGTLQIGEPSVIAEETGVTTVADFRPRDIAAGGLGAPLAPFFHYLIFRHSSKTRAVHNIGGISNLTFLPAGRNIDSVMGFDTGPGNMVIDGVLRELTDQKISYDHGGRRAARGRIHLGLLREMMKHPFVRARPPKTSGREEFGRPFVRGFMRRAIAIGLKADDMVATATAFTASSIAENYRRFIFPKSIPEEIIFSGGGVHNKTLMAMLRAELVGVRLSTLDEHGIPSDAAEAVCFAILAYESLRGRETNLPSVTGAKHPVVLGKIVMGRGK